MTSPYYYLGSIKAESMTREEAIEAYIAACQRIDREAVPESVKRRWLAEMAATGWRRQVVRLLRWILERA